MNSKQHSDEDDGPARPGHDGADVRRGFTTDAGVEIMHDLQLIHVDADAELAHVRR
jgi:hypothetical protein